MYYSVYSHTKPYKFLGDMFRLDISHHQVFP